MSTTPPVPLTFLAVSIDSVDGVSRAVLTLADELSRNHPVEVVSIYRRPEGRAFPVSDRVRVTYLLNRPPPRRDGARRAAGPGRRRVRALLGDQLVRRPSRLARGRGFPQFNLLTDAVVARKVRSVREGVLISTRPALHLVAARLARPGVVTIGQDHLNFVTRSDERDSLDSIADAARAGLDAFVTLTPSDAVDYERLLAGTGTRITPIGNSLSWPVMSAEQLRAAGRGAPGRRVVVSAGRLVQRKGMGRLINAFAPVARRHPDWELHIHGSGRLRDMLQGRIEELGLDEQVRLMGHSGDLASAFARADVFAAASRAEGYPMVMLEAMSTGLPLVAMDCPRGPADIVDDGRNGLLVPADDVAALSEALERVVSDADLRERMSEQALHDAAAHTGDRVAARWEDLFATLGADRRG